MASLTISKAAREQILELIVRAAIAQPVVYLIETSGPVKVAPELNDAVLRGESESTIAELASKSVPADWETGTRRLQAAIYPREQLSRLFLRKIDGLVFYVPPRLAKKMKGCVLHFGDQGFQLKNADGVIVMPST